MPAFKVPSNTGAAKKGLQVHRLLWGGTPKYEDKTPRKTIIEEYASKVKFLACSTMAWELISSQIFLLCSAKKKRNGIGMAATDMAI